ncbi:MAG TPA: hypothetical protein VMF89_00575 [Polyangiales bacterium]|nr:hypothetical protein [Polyangiales bacterium]
MDHLSGNLRSLIGLTRREGFSKTEKARLWRRIEHAAEQREVERMAPRGRLGLRWLSLGVAVAACALLAVQLPQAELSRVACQVFQCADTQPAVATSQTPAPKVEASAAQVAQEPKSAESCAPSAPRGRAAGSRVASRAQRGFSRGAARSTKSHNSATSAATEAAQARAEAAEELSFAERLQPPLQDEQPTARVAAAQPEASSQVNDAPSESELRERRLKKLIHDAKQRYNGALGERALLAASQRALPSVARY